MVTNSVMIYENNSAEAGSFFWTSATDVGYEPGQFYWPDGTQVDKATWYKGEPRYFGAGKDACVYVYNVYNKLGDIKCSHSGTMAILCELPAALAYCL